MLEFVLPDMTCGHCVSTVTKTIQSIDPAAVVTIDLPSHLVTVDTNAQRELVASALTEEGYQPS